MYQELYQSSIRPFRATPDTAFYFAHDSIESARQTAVRAVTRAEGPVVVLGGAGLGKSLLAEMVALDVRERLDIVRLHAARLCSRQALLQNILFELHLPYRELSEGELRLSILDRLEPAAGKAPDGVLMIVDEAHTLPAKLLDELRLISNFTRNNQPRARLLLLGNMRLEDTFTGPLMDSFNQRLAARCYLQPMSRRDTVSFVRHQLSVAGVAANTVITQEGLEALYAASEGVPRLANQIMDHALMLAIDNKQSPISSSLVEEAWADLQQLPTPWSLGTEPLAAVGGGASSSIEFGSLDDFDSHESASIDSGDIDSGDIDSGDIDSGDIDSGSSEFNADEIPSIAFPTLADIVEPAAVQATDNAVPAINLADFLEDNQHFSVEDYVEQFASDAAVPNYFSAFSMPAEDDGFEGTSEETFEDTREGSVDEEVEQDVAPDSPAVAVSVEPVFAPQPLFDASTAFSPLPIQSVSAEFFADRPTDSELLAYEDEAVQYDSMGVWENDPPLEVAEKVVKPQASQVTTIQADSVVSSPAVAARENLFGDDFDEEIAIPGAAVASLRNDEAAGGGELAAEVAEYLDRIQAFADAIGQANGDTPTVEQVIAAEAANAESNGIEQAWQVDTLAVDEQNALQIANDIEDLVSQLNFSAFSVEPYSVEQISVDPPRPREIPADSVRSGDNAEIYMLHRAQGAETRSIFETSGIDYDDDRDLLIIEEDLPVSSKMTDQLASEKAATKVSPYNQLFARLRK